MANDVDRFDRWAATYERSYLQRLVFEPVHRTLVEVALRERPDARAILDVGCGTGRLLRALSAAFPGARLDGVDAAPSMAAQARAMAPAGMAVTFTQATAEKLPFPDGSFDLVFSSMTFHHWADQQAGIAEVGRVMAPDGRWLLADFVATGWMKYIRRVFRLRRFRERGELDGMLQAVGLTVAGVNAVRGLGKQVPVLVIATPARLVVEKKAP
jgi:ubiquinone/menaquinone biosynthesis C-methylase UbiE